MGPPGTAGPTLGVPGPSAGEAAPSSCRAAARTAGLMLTEPHRLPQVASSCEYRERKRRERNPNRKGERERDNE